MYCKHPISRDIGPLIAAARTGSPAALGQLFQACRDYLQLIANREVGRDLRTKVAASDLVQETFVKAQVYFDGFDGTSEVELFAWLRRILFNQIVDVRRQYSGTLRRDLSRETVLLNDSSAAKSPEELPGREKSPSKCIAANEDACCLAAAIEALPHDFRQVIELRHWQRLSFAEIGLRLDRSSEAARKLWVRAIAQLERSENLRHVRD